MRFYGVLPQLARLTEPRSDDLAKLQAQDQTISQDQIITALVELLKTERDSSAIVLSRLLELRMLQ